MRQSPGRDPAGTRAALHLVMHAVFFAMKRAYQRSLTVTRPSLDAVGLTPARYDLLHALRSNILGMTQVELCRTLGVSGATVSRMLKSLENLGLVMRHRDVLDRRFRIARITKLARYVMRRAYRRVIGSGFIQRAIERAVAIRRSTSFIDLCNFDESLTRVRTSFGDVADLHYWWHPDD